MSQRQSGARRDLGRNVLSGPRRLNLVKCTLGGITLAECEERQDQASRWPSHDSRCSAVQREGASRVALRAPSVRNPGFSLNEVRVERVDAAARRDSGIRQSTQD